MVSIVSGLEDLGHATVPSLPLEREVYLLKDVPSTRVMGGQEEAHCTLHAGSKESRGHHHWGMARPGKLPHVSVRNTSFLATAMI